jgi:pimeloyl-ACP methyl ester carboxylesterase
VPVERELLTLEARDGALHDALLHVDERALRARERRTGRRTAVLHTHGIMGNFLVGTLRFLPAPLARAGWPTLVLDTRMGNVGQLFGQAVFEDALLDLEAGARLLRDRGFHDLVVSGYSSGATLATLFAASRRRYPVRALVGVGTPWSLPDAARRRSDRFGSEPSYRRMTNIARAATAAGEDRHVVITRATGPTRLPHHTEVYTCRTWWHSRGPDAEPAMAGRQIGLVRAPVLLVQGTADEVVEPGEAEALARAAGHRAEVAWVEGVGHSFAGGEQRVIEIVTRWLAARC